MSHFVCSRIRATKDYDTHPFGVVDVLNGRRVKNLDQIATKLRDSNDELVVLEPFGQYESIVFRTAQMEAAT